MSPGARVGLLFGGRSVEHEVSVTSARGVARAMARTDLVCVPLAVTAEGRWLSPALSLELLESEAARVEVAAQRDDGRRVVLDPGGGGLICCGPDDRREPVELQVMFPLVHGWGGEDGRLQGALELAGVPYVGSGVLGSALGMDKVKAKQILRAGGIPVVDWIDFTASEYGEHSEGWCRRAISELGLPLFVKPVNGGSSVGVSKVGADGELPGAIELALAHDRRVLVERGIDAREIECAVLGNERVEASGLGEIVPSRDFYTYEAKYVDNTSRLEIPARLSPERAESIQRMAQEAFRALELSGLARVDFLVERGVGTIFVNEVNTLPGFTPISMYPKLWEAAGLSYPRLIERLVQLALDRSREGQRRQSGWFER